MKSASFLPKEQLVVSIKLKFKQSEPGSTLGIKKILSAKIYFHQSWLNEYWWQLYWLDIHGLVLWQPWEWCLLVKNVRLASKFNLITSNNPIVDTMKMLGSSKCRIDLVEEEYGVADSNYLTN